MFMTEKSRHEDIKWMQKRKHASREIWKNYQWILQSVHKYMKHTLAVERVVLYNEFRYDKLGLLSYFIRKREVRRVKHINFLHFLVWLRVGYIG